MNPEQEKKQLLRPDLRVNPSKWSATHKSNFATRLAVVGALTGIIGGITLVFLYPYFHIEQFRMLFFKNSSN